MGIVTLPMLKVALGITTTAQDTLLTQAEARAAAWVEEQLGNRRFQAPAEVTEYVEGKDTTRLILRGHVAADTEIASVTERLSPSSEAKAFTAFTRRGDVLVRTDGQPWYLGAEYAVTYQDGYPAGQAPGDVQELVVELVEKMLVRADGTGGIASETIGDYSYSLDTGSLATDRLTDIGKATLNRWRRLSI